MSIKLTTAHTARGLSVPIFVIATGLNHTELKLDNKKDFIECKGLHALKVKSLSLCSSTNPSNDQCSHAVFAKKSKEEECDSEESRVKFCREKALHEFTNNIRNNKKKMVLNHLFLIILHIGVIG